MIIQPLKVLLVCWGTVMSAITGMLVVKVIQLDDVAREELDLMEERDTFYKSLILREAHVIDTLNAEITDLQAHEELRQRQEELDKLTHPKSKGTSL